MSRDEINSVKYFKFLVEEIHSLVVATSDINGLPFTRVIDMMLYDDEGVYFLTAKGKNFYKQLMDKPYISLSGMVGGEHTMERKALSMSGPVRNIGTDKLNEIFDKNPYMADIYQTEESRKALEVFHFYKGRGEFFDLSTKPITRESFSFGGIEYNQTGYYISEGCTGCGVCIPACPVQSIQSGSPYKIIQENCLHCGNCYSLCPAKAVVKK